MKCVESLRAQAYFDGEVDAMSAIEIERHCEHCAECSALLADLEYTRGMIRQHLPLEDATPQLHRRIMRALDDEPSGSVKDGLATGPPPSEPTRRGVSGRAAPAAMRVPLRPRPSRQFWFGGAFGMAAGVAAAALVFGFLVVPTATPLAEQLIAAHVRSLLPAHLIDVASTDKHTVKPWFAGHADVSPVVADFAEQGYPLAGGRADYLDHQRAAVVVYRHGAHVINVFSWASRRASPPKDTTVNGYHLAFWKAGNVEYCAVSDTGWDELKGLERLLRDASNRDAPA